MDEENRSAAGRPHRPPHGDPSGMRGAGRTVWRWRWLDDAARDLRVACRSLARQPGHAAAAMVTLVLGIGATTATFTVFNGVLLQPAPYPESDRLVQLFLHRPAGATGQSFRTGQFTREQFDGWHGATRAFSHMALFGMREATVRGRSGPVRLSGAPVSTDFFAVLGVAPALGRIFIPEDAQAGREPVVVLGHDAWVAHFGADPAVLDEAVQVDDDAYRVVGVMPAGFDYPGVLPSWRTASGRRGGGAGFWTPLRPAATEDGSSGRRADRSGAVVARLAPGVALDQAKAEAGAVLPRLPDSDGARAELEPLYEQIVAPARPVLRILFAAVFLVLAVAVANVAALTLARAESRRHALEVRRALGADRAALVRYAMAESVVVAVVGGLGGWMAARAAVRAVGAAASGVVPRLAELTVDGTAVAFVVAVTGVCALTTGLAPALGAGRTANAQGVLPHGGQLPVTSPSRRFRLIVVTEVALATMLLVAAALMITSFVRVTAVEPGFDPDRVLTFSVPVPESRYPTARDRQRVAAQMAETLDGLAGVDEVALANSLPFQMLGIVCCFSIDGEQPNPTPTAASRIVAPGYFEALRIPIVAGRPFAARDRDGQPRVVIVSQAFVRRYLAGSDPLGMQVGLDRTGPARIVGVVGSVRHRLTGSAMPELFFPYAQQPEGLGIAAPTFALRTAGDPVAALPMVRRAVAEVDAGLAVDDAAALDRRMADSLGGMRFRTLAMAVFGVVAMLLAAGGIGGVLLHAVNRRVPEIGIRIALGARPGTILRLVYAHGLAPAGAGIIIGLGAAVSLTGYLQSLLWGTAARDPLVFGGVAALLVVVAWGACSAPALRAARISPVEALRRE